MTKSELQDATDHASQILSDAYTPESSREDLAAAADDALDAPLGGDDDNTDDDDEHADDTYTDVA
jgi:hypothetical protein